METTLLKLSGKLGKTLVKATAATFVSTIAAQKSRTCMRDLADQAVQNIRYVKNMHSRA
jgi:hypothetical protein